MTNILSKRQAVILFACLTISFKLQRLPSLVSEIFKRDSFIAIAFLYLIDFLLLLLICRLYKKMGQDTIFRYIEKNAGRFWLIVFCVLTIVFFMFKGVIAYKQIHEFFANTLFNRLPWKFFSVLFLALLILIIKSGLKNIGRNGEFYLYIMLGSILTIVGVGVFSSNFTRLLPFLDLDILKEGPNVFKFACWFLDPIIILFFAGNIKEEKPRTKPFILTHIFCSLFVILGTATFYAINEYMVAFQSNGLTSMTEFTIIKLGIGRPDWFLVLFVNIANVIITALLLWVVKQCVMEIFKAKNSTYFSAGVVLTVYLWDELFYRNLELGIFVTTNYASVYMWAYALVIPLVVLLLKPKLNNAQTPIKAVNRV